MSGGPCSLCLTFPSFSLTRQAVWPLCSHVQILGNPRVSIRTMSLWRFWRSLCAFFSPSQSRKLGCARLTSHVSIFGNCITLTRMASATLAAKWATLKPRTPVILLSFQLKMRHFVAPAMQAIISSIAQPDRCSLVMAGVIQSQSLRNGAFQNRPNVFMNHPDSTLDGYSAVTRPISSERPEEATIFSPATEFQDLINPALVDTFHVTNSAQDANEVSK